MQNIYEMYSNIDKSISNAIEKGIKRFAICPMGMNGILTKQILNIRYGIIEELIIDNGLAKINPSIITVEDLKKYDTQGLAILLNSTSSLLNHIISLDLQAIVPLKQIIECTAHNFKGTLEIIDKPEKASYFKKLRRLLKIMDTDPNVKYVRIGSDNDGGYIMLDDFKNVNIAYSFGIGSNATWDLDIAKHGINVYQYDPSINSTPIYNENFHFFKRGIAKKDNFANNSYSLETILMQNGHNNYQNMVLKMDVEGEEWGILNNTASHVFSQFKQITMELHYVTDNSDNHNVIQALENINKTHQLVWIHGNNYSIAEKAEDIMMPISLEATYLKRDDYNFSKSNRIFPTDLDMPCNKDADDYLLGDWS